VILLLVNLLVQSSVACYYTQTRSCSPNVIYYYFYIYIFKTICHFHTVFYCCQLLPLPLRHDTTFDYIFYSFFYPYHYVIRSLQKTVLKNRSTTLNAAIYLHFGLASYFFHVTLLRNSFSSFKFYTYCLQTLIISKSNLRKKYYTSF